MPPRVARSSVGSSQPAKGPAKPPRNSKKSTKRALDAFSIAEHENPEKSRVSRHRLGEIERSDERKRPRGDDEEEENEEDQAAAAKRRKRKGGDETYDEGSDSDGNTWQMGDIDVDDDDDEDIDSDEAFGESDEERFEGYSFRGSSTNKDDKAKKAKKAVNTEDQGDDMDLDEDDSADGEEEDDDDDDLGDDAIDLATALDQYEEDEAEHRRLAEKKKKKHGSAFESESDEFPSEGEDIAADGASDLSSDSEEEEEDRQAQLKDLISSLATRDADQSKGRRVEVHESAVPDEFGVASKVDLLSFKPKVADKEKKRSLKLLQDDKTTKRTDIARKLDAPLPKRQQDKLDRAAANAKANETLARWTDTVKKNRRAEHLIFPLQNNGGDSVGENRLQPTTTAAPTNDLESAIQSILQQSGLSNGKDGEEQIEKWETLQTNKLPIAEVQRRRAELRLQRDLMFREEVRAKRIKKIKSKSYRRVHRKERQKMMEKERDQLRADGVDVSEDEREHNDRRRAEERMGAKHREGKWAKSIKATGRAAWDSNALESVTEMAKRNEELRRRQEGKTVRDSDEDASDVPSDEDESEDSSDDENADDAGLQRSLGKLKTNPFSMDNSRLGSMAFMQRAEAAKRTQNDEEVERMRREIAGEDSISEEERENAPKTGRRTYGPGKDLTLPRIPSNRNELEEAPPSDEEDATDGAGKGVESATNDKANKARKSKSSGPLAEDSRKTQNKQNFIASKATTDEPEPMVNPFFAKTKKEKKQPEEESGELLPLFEDLEPVELVEPKKIAVKAKPQAKAAAKPKDTRVDAFLEQRVTAADDDGWATVLGGQDDDDEADEQANGDEDDGFDLTTILRNQALTAKGFAGDDAAADFSTEKNAAIEEEASTETTTYLPGWGAWTGSNMTAAEKKRNKGQKTVIKTTGIDANKRKDKKLDKVIINEKRIKPTVKYMASQLPFPFETREQYERSLRVPKGKEWVSKTTFQSGTKPRVIVKQGIIAPLRKPLV
jgi:U3 small nucleolar RNA-associated protein 14